MTDLPRIRGFQHAVLGPAASGRSETGLGIPGVEPRHGRADWHALGYSGLFRKFEGHSSCQWNVTADGYCHLPLLSACPWFLLRSGAVSSCHCLGPGAASPPGRARLGLPDLPCPTSIAPLTEKSSGFKTCKVQCVRLSVNITLKDATPGKPKPRC